MEKLERCGICGNLLSWFKSYLMERRQIVKIKGFTSREVLVESGVPRGSHLSPLLFNIFINDVTDFITHSKFLLYADDLKIYKVIQSLDDCFKLQQDLNGLSEWCRLNGMSLNISKCKVMQFYRKKNVLFYDYKIQDDILDKTDVMKDLGVYFVKDLNFNYHINFMTNKALKMLGFIKRTLTDFNDINCIKTLYIAYVRSILEYACPVWGPYYKIYVEQIERIQRKFLRFVGFKMGIPVEDIAIEEIMYSLNLPSLGDRRKFIDICTLFKILNSQIDCPSLLSELSLHVPRRILRGFGLFHIPFHRTNYGMSSALTRFCVEANQIIDKDCDIDFFCDNINSFKNKVKAVVL